jgi:hypothetical protein
VRPVTDYFLEAVESVRANKVRYAEAEARARQPRFPQEFQVRPGAQDHEAAALQ